MSSVRSRMRSSATTRPLQVASSRRASSPIIGANARIRSPWNGPCISRRSRMCSSPSSSRIECGPGERAQELPALSRRRDRRIEPEHRADRVGAREQHHRLLGPVRPDRRRVAEAVVDTAQERAGAGHPRERLPDGGRARSRRQVHRPILRARSEKPGRHERRPGLYRSVRSRVLWVLRGYAASGTRAGSAPRSTW